LGYNFAFWPAIWAIILHFGHFITYIILAFGPGSRFWP
jgi:hypothetical protein